MAKRGLRVGVIGAGRVLRHSWPALCRAGHRLVVVGSRDVCRAETLLQSILKDETEVDDYDYDNRTDPMPALHTQQPWPTICRGYDAVVRGAEVDVVYITLPVALRHEWVMAALAQGKHVLTETPVAVNAAQLRVWLTAASPRRLLCMDATALSHSRRVHGVRQALHSLGPVQHVVVHMTVADLNEAAEGDDIRLVTALEPYGALGDGGWSCIRWILHIMDFALPSHVSARVTHSAVSSKEKEVQEGLTSDCNNREAANANASATASCPAESEQKQNRRGAAILGFEGQLHFALPRINDKDDNNTHCRNNNPNNNRGYQAMDGRNRGGGGSRGGGDVCAQSHDSRSVTATFYCSLTESWRQTVRVFAQHGVLVVHAAADPSPHTAPSFTVERYAWDEDSSSGLTQRLRRQVVTCAGECSGRFQRDQLWRDVGEALMALMPGEPLVAEAAKALVWSSYAYRTQIVMDELLVAARANVVTAQKESVVVVSSSPSAAATAEAGAAV